MMVFVPISVLALFFAAAAPVREVGPARYHAVSPKRAVSSADLVMSASRLPARARHVLRALAASEKTWLDTREWREGIRPKSRLKVGVARALEGDVGFESMAADLRRERSLVAGGGLLEETDDGRLVWTAAFASEGAAALRLHLRTAVLPPGSRVFVYSAAGDVRGPYTFDSGTASEGFWTNTIYAPEMFLEVQVPGSDIAALGRARLLVDAVAHLEYPEVAPAGASRDGTLQPKSQTCFVDAACVSASEFPNLDDASHAVGQLTFQDGNSFFVCTGGLLNSNPQTFIPYLLTANHCFSTQASATSLEVVWNYKTATCGGVPPNPATLPQSLGSTLLATGTVSDFTLVQLSGDAPDGAVFLGWTTQDIATGGAGTILRRLSNSSGGPMVYTRERVSATPDPAACADSPQGNFIYEKDEMGGTGGGSSGSLAYTSDLQVVGQELGGCGLNVNDDCDVIQNSTLDGAIRVSFPFLQPFIAPAQTPVRDTVVLTPTRGEPRNTVTVPPRP
jgi:lysyl endopeptidase